MIKPGPACRLGIGLAGLKAALLCGAMGTATPLPAAAQAATAVSGIASASPSPMQCWWRASNSMVMVGEQFLLVLTCTVRETPEMKAVPDFSEIEPGSLRVAPFEVVGGRRYEDLLVGSERFFQFEYTLRLIAEDYFGGDVLIPPLDVVYNMEIASSDVVQQGRDRTYVLPPIPMRIASLVPELTSDIRDASTETFGAIEARRSRSDAMRLAAFVCLAFGAVLLVLALAGLARRLAKRRVVVESPLTTWRMLLGALREIDSIRSAVIRAGWTDVQVSRTLGLARIAGAVALKKPIAQARHTGTSAPDEGQLLVRTGLIRRKQVLVSASVTPEAFLQRGAARDILADNGTCVPNARELRRVLSTLSSERYGSNPQMGSGALELVLDEVEDIFRQLLIAGLVPASLVRLKRSMTVLRA